MQAEHSVSLSLSLSVSMPVSVSMGVGVCVWPCVYARDLVMALSDAYATADDYKVNILCYIYYIYIYIYIYTYICLVMALAGVCHAGEDDRSRMPPQASPSTF
jgi:hypothetical protein